MKITYMSGYKFDIEERGHHLITDQPSPASGDEGMTPLELQGAALGGCVGVYAVGYLKRHNLPVDGLTVEVTAEGAQNPNRVGRYVVKLNIPAQLDERHRVTLERTVKACPVHNTLEHAPVIDFRIVES